MKSIKFYLIACIIAGIIFSGCDTPKERLNIEKEKIKLLRLNKLGAKALIEKKVEFLKYLDRCNDTIGYVVSKGEIYHVTPDSKKTDKQVYDDYGFDKITYKSIDEIAEPFIFFSEDGSMAVMIGKEKYTSERTDSTGKLHTGSKISSFLAIYERKDTCWYIRALAQTSK